MRFLAPVLWLLYRQWRHGLRSHAGLAETVVAASVAVLGAALSLGLAAGLGAVAHLTLAAHESESTALGLSIVFWMLAFLGVGVPVAFGIAQRELPVHRLLVFPMTRGELYRLSLAASAASGIHIFWYPSLAAVIGVALGAHGIPAVPWLPLVGVFAAALLVWSHAARQAVQLLLRRRRAREVAVLVGMALVVSVTMVPAYLDSSGELGGGPWRPMPAPLPAAVTAAAAVLPPALAASGTRALDDGDPRGAAVPMLWLVLWCVAGLAAGARLFDATLESGRSAVPAARAARRARWSLVDRLPVLPPQLAALASRELRYLLRSTAGRFNIVIMPVFAAVMGMLAVDVADRRILGLEGAGLAFVAVMLYTSMFSNNFLFNAYAWEGPGVRCYFQMPVSPRGVVLAKNLGVWIYDLLLAVECALVLVVTVGVPGWGAAASGCLAFAASVVACTTVGNFVSPTVPVARSISSIGNSPSQTGVALSFATVLLVTALVGGMLLAASSTGQPWLAPGLLLLLLAAQAGLYRALLEPAARLLEARRESLLEALDARV